MIKELNLQLSDATENGGGDYMNEVLDYVFEAEADFDIESDVDMHRVLQGFSTDNMEQHKIIVTDHQGNEILTVYVSAWFDHDEIQVLMTDGLAVLTKEVK